MLLPTKFDGVQFMKTYVMQKSAEISALIVQHKLTTHLSGDREGDFRTTRLRSRLSTRGEADRDRLFRSPFDLVASLGGDLTGDSRVSLAFFFADSGGSGEAEDDEDRLASRVFAFLAESASA